MLWSGQASLRSGRSKSDKQYISPFVRRGDIIAKGEQYVTQHLYSSFRVVIHLDDPPYGESNSISKHILILRYKKFGCEQKINIFLLYY
jgi:hypothetical protein